MQDLNVIRHLDRAPVSSLAVPCCCYRVHRADASAHSQCFWRVLDRPLPTYNRHAMSPFCEDIWFAAENVKALKASPSLQLAEKVHRLMLWV